MGKRKKFATGGLIPGAVRVVLDDAECLVDGAGECKRRDAVHEAYHAAALADTSRKGSSDGA